MNEYGTTRTPSVTSQNCSRGRSKKRRQCLIIRVSSMPCSRTWKSSLRPLVEGVPEGISSNRHATAYFGLFRLVLGDDKVLPGAMRRFEKLALTIDRVVTDAIAENSLNPHNIEAAIRKALLPLLFSEIGLDHAKTMTERVVEVVRVGLSRDGF